MNRNDVGGLLFFLTPFLMVVHIGNVVVYGAPVTAWTFFLPLLSLHGMFLMGVD